MKKTTIILFSLFILAASGCTEKPEAVAESLTCEDYGKITDQAVKAELLKKCPRIGPAFKRSSNREW